MTGFSIKINNPDKEYKEIKEELALYNVLPVNIGDWNVFNYLFYDPEQNIMTNYSSYGIIRRDYIRCSSTREFINSIKKVLNIEEKIILTIDEIAKKFGYPVEQLRIKK